jgi:hypothetical protein
MMHTATRHPPIGIPYRFQQQVLCHIPHTECLEDHFWLELQSRQVPFEVFFAIVLLLPRKLKEVEIFCREALLSDGSEEGQGVIKTRKEGEP